MVVRSGRLQALLMLTIMLSASLSVADTSGTEDNVFSISVDRHTIEYGKSIILAARSTETDAELDALSFAELKHDFAIELVTRDKQADSLTHQWRLYPRHPGHLTLPALEYADHKSDPIELTVTPAIDPRDGQPIRITTDMPETRVWLRQAVPLRMTLETASSIIVLRRDDAAHDALAIREIEPAVQPVGKKRERYRHTTGWIIHPLQSGQHPIELPPLRYVRDGVTTHRFYPPRLQLAVRPLPPYLPPSMPIGRLSVEIDRPARFLFTDALKQVKVRLQGHGIREQNMPQLQRQLRNTAEITLYPAQQMRRESIEAGRLISHSEYDIPLRVKQSGRITLPDFRLDYFDPQTGRIVSLKTDGQTVYALNRWLFFLLVGVLMIALWFGIRKLLPIMHRHIRRLHGYIRVLALLPQADSDEMVVKLLRDLASKEGWSANLTLAHWWQCWQNHYVPDVRIDQAIEALMLKRYAGQPLDIRQVREQLHAALFRQHIIAGWVGRFAPINT